MKLRPPVFHCHGTYHLASRGLERRSIVSDHLDRQKWTERTLGKIGNDDLTPIWLMIPNPPEPGNSSLAREKRESETLLSISKVQGEPEWNQEYCFPATPADTSRKKDCVPNRGSTHGPV